MKQLFIFFALIILTNSGFSQNPILKISENADYINLKGKIDKYPIEMFLSLYGGGDGVFSKNKMISGYYSYSNIKKPIRLTGNFKAKDFEGDIKINGGEINLFELNEDFEKTALFKGEFIDTVGILGVWSTLDNNKKLDFELEFESLNPTDRTRNSYILETKFDGEIYKTDLGLEFKYKPIIDDYLYFKKDDRLFIIASVFYWSNGVGNGRGNCGAGNEIYVFFLEISTETKLYKEQQFQMTSCMEGIFGTLIIDNTKYDINEIGWMSKSYRNLKENFKGSFNEMTLKTECYSNSTKQIEFRLFNDNISEGFKKNK